MCGPRRLVGLAASILLVAGCGANSSSSPAPSRFPRSLPGGGTVAGSIPDMVSRVEPSVVTILVPGGGLGSGVVFRADGVIVTNAHVVGQERSVVVTFADGSQTPGQVAGADQTSDLAVIRAERRELPAARFQPKLPRPGETVLAMGSPLGFVNSVTQGVISGVGRQLPATGNATFPMVDLLQTDAPISPGSSGGALVNTRGEVIGLNEAYIPPQAGAVALGFAIPAATVVDAADQILATGRVTHAYVGVEVAQVTQQIARALGLPVDAGVLVRRVVDGGPAASAGIRAGDVIVRFNGTDTPQMADFLTALRRAKPGDRARLEIRRGGATSTVEVVLGALSAR